MNKKELWKFYTDKNPHWKTENVTLTPEGLKKLVETTFTVGHKQGFDNGYAVGTRSDRDDKTKKKDKHEFNMKDLFGDLFT